MITAKSTTLHTTLKVDNDTYELLGNEVFKNKELINADKVDFKIIEKLLNTEGKIIEDNYSLDGNQYFKNGKPVQKESIRHGILTLFDKKHTEDLKEFLGINGVNKFDKKLDQYTDKHKITSQFKEESQFTEEQRKHFDTLYNDTYHAGYEAGQGKQTKLKEIDDNFINTNPFNFSPKQIKDINIYLNKTYLIAYKEGQIDKQKIEEQPEISCVIKDQNTIKDCIIAIKNHYLKHRDKTQINKPEFYDPQQIFPKRNSKLLCGDTQAGKTAFALKFLSNRLKEGDKVLIWEHSETNRMNRLNQWIEKEKLEEYRDNGSLYISPDKMDLLNRITPECILFIDDADSFFRIKKTTDRREVADCLEDVSWICQLIGFLIIMAHYQSKTSKSEKDPKCRSGGDMSWLNKQRYASIIEIGDRIDTKPTVDQSNNEEIKSKKTPFLTVQKGHRDKDLPTAWWLNEDFSIGDSISDDDLKQIIFEKTEHKINNIPNMINEVINNYLKENDQKRIPSKELKDSCKAIGISADQIWYYMKREPLKSLWVNKKDTSKNGKWFYERI